MVKSADSSPSDSTRLVTSHDLSSLDVVVVDNSPFNLRLMRQVLGSIGVEHIRCMMNPELALADMQKATPDLIITDLAMAPFDGLELIRKVRTSSDVVLRVTPIFTLSGETDLDYVMGAHIAGAHEILAKPISTEQIYKRIVSHVESPRKIIETETYFGPDRRRRERAYDGVERRGAKTTSRYGSDGNGQ